jgi:hypothetical protein
MCSSISSICKKSCLNATPQSLDTERRKSLSLGKVEFTEVDGYLRITMHCIVLCAMPLN